MEICTIGASGTCAKRFFSCLKEANITALVDTRLHPSSQLAGFAKRESLSYFLPEIIGVSYLHEPLLAPEKGILTAYRSGEMSWDDYEVAYRGQLLTSRAHQRIDFSGWGHRPVLLCSEHSPDRCHRRLATDFLHQTLDAVTQIEHLRT